MTIVGLLQTVPPLLFGPVIGVFLDRLPKKTVMVWVDLIRTVMTFLIPALFALDLLSLEGLYVLIFLTSIVSTIFGPALVSVVPRLVRPSELVTANALIQGTNNIGLLLGLAISGVLIAMMGAENVLYVNSATFFVSALCLIPMRFHETPKTAEEASNISASVLDDLKVGFRFVFGTQSTVFLLVIISALYNLAQSLIGLGLVLLLTAAVAIRFMRQAVMAQRVAAYGAPIVPSVLLPFLSAPFRYNLVS